jgi:hypothetical protein
MALRKEEAISSGVLPGFLIAMETALDIFIFV